MFMEIKMSIKWSKIILLLLGCIAVYCLGWLLYYADAIIAHRADKSPYPFYTTSATGEHLIAHAGGKIGGHIYTNSQEAYAQALKHGMKFIEIDLSATTDGTYAAVHDWELFNKSIGLNGDKPQSIQTIRNAKIYNRYSPMDEQQIVELMRNNQQLVMVTDKTRDVKHLAKAFPFPDRIIVQTFHLYDYIKALKLGFKYPTLRLKGGRHGIPFYYRKLMEWANVKSVILGELSFNKNKDFIKELHDRGVTVILYGNPSYRIVENPEEIKKYAGSYIDLVDTDTLNKL